MAVTFRSNQNVSIAVVTGVLDEVQGKLLLFEIRVRVPRGGELIVDGAGLTSLTPEGLRYLGTVQQWSSNPKRQRLRLAGFGPALWQVIAGQHSENLFEATETLPGASDSSGAETTAGAMGNFRSISKDSDGSDTVAGLPRPDLSTPPPIFPSDEATSESPTVVPLAAPPRVPPPPPPLPATRPAAPAPPLPAMPGLAATVVTVAPMPPPRVTAPPIVAPGLTPPGSGGLSKPLLFSALAGAFLLLLGLGGVAWFFLGKRAPVVSVSAPRVTAEEDGKEVDETTVEVRRGKLVEASWQGLPQGLFFEAATEGEANSTYLLHGKAENGAHSATVQLEAVDAKGRHSPPVPFTVEVKEKPLSWQLTTLMSLDLKEKGPVMGESKFVTGAAQAPSANGLPPGLRVELAPGTTRDWQLAGTPATAGQYAVTFKAATAAGTAEEKTCTLQVAGAPAAPVIDAASTGTAGGGRTPGRLKVDTGMGRQDGGSGGGMRKFMLERIEKLPSRYTDEERENLRLVVNELKQARLAAHLIFEHPGQTNVSAEQAAKLTAALSAPEVQALLKDPNCQVAIVGYASKTGGLAANVRYSKQRAHNVNELCSAFLGRDADLCGDYGPTDIVDRNSEQANRAVEIYVGVMDLPADLREKAASFRREFNYRHGMH